MCSASLASASTRIPSPLNLTGDLDVWHNVSICRFHRCDDIKFESGPKG